MSGASGRKGKGKGKTLATVPEVPIETLPPTNPNLLDIVFTNGEQHKRFERLMRRGVTATRYGDPQILARMGILDNVNDLLGAAGLAKCLAPRPTYLRFVLEFFSTLKLRDDSDSCKSKVYSISFRLLNQDRTLRLAELERIYGFKKQTVGDVEGLKAFELQHFWEQITAAQDIVPPMAYDARTSRLTSIRSPVVRYLQKLLSTTICARKELSSPRQYELEILWALVDRRVRDSQADLISCFEKIVKDIGEEKKKEIKIPEPVTCGALITPILEHYQIDLSAYKPISESCYWSWDELEALRVVMLGFASGKTGPVIPYVCQNRGPYLRLPNPTLTQIRNLTSRENLELSSAAHLAASVDPESEEIMSYRKGRTVRPVARGRTEAGGGEGSSQGGSQRRKRAATSTLSQEEFQERQEGLLSTLVDDVKEMGSSMARLETRMGSMEAEMRGQRESQNKMMELLQSIKGCFTGH